jgi:hypothetical protein
MKKTPSKLLLHRETLTALDLDQTRDIAGGGTLGTCAPMSMATCGSPCSRACTVPCSSAC